MILFLLSGCILGAFVTLLIQKVKLATVQQLANELLFKAQLEAKQYKERIAQEGKTDEAQRIHALELQKVAQQGNLQQKESQLAAKETQLAKLQQNLEKKEAECARQLKSIQQKNEELSALLALSPEEMKKELFAQLEKASEKQVHKQLEEAKAKAEEEASRIIQNALMRIAQKQIPDTHLLSIPIEEEMKGRLIGRDGRNMRAFEWATGTTLIVDATPHKIHLSCFDPLRREIAHKALQELLNDGRITPERIEVVVAKQTSVVTAEAHAKGKEAALQAGVAHLHPEISRLLGKLHFRSSLGQNVLQHSIEVSHIMGLIAAELGLDEKKARRIGLLHDMGKALPAEFGLSHALAGHRFALEHGEKADVASGIGGHHDEMEPLCREAMLCKAADALSASRAGARENRREQTVKRMEALETIAQSFPQVEKAYALQGGEQLTLFMRHDAISHLQSEQLVEMVRQKIEQELHLPSIQLRVQVIWAQS